MTTEKTNTGLSSGSVMCRNNRQPSAPVNLRSFVKHPRNALQTG